MGADLKWMLGRLRSPKSLLRSYEEFLISCYNIAEEPGDLSGAEIEELFFRRSALALILRKRPDGLTPEQRKHLRALDAKLRELKPIIADPYYAYRGEKLGCPKSHWWWYLGDERKKKRPAKRAVRTRRRLV